MTPPKPRLHRKIPGTIQRALAQALVGLKLITGCFTCTQFSVQSIINLLGVATTYLPTPCTIDDGNNVNIGDDGEGFKKHTAGKTCYI
jgi:hypothetical protein